MNGRPEKGGFPVMKRLLLLLCILCLCWSWGLCEKSATLLLYISGNDLESAACAEIQELMEGEYADEFNICVWAGGSNNWGGEFGFENGQLNQVVVGNEEFLEQNTAGKVSVGKPETLSDFIVSSIREYPADRYFLMLYDHGSGPAGGMLFDGVFRYEHIGMSGLHKALVQAQQQLGDLSFDIISVHACLMGTVELLAACQDFADYIVCSEELVLAGSLKNTFLLSSLQENPDIPSSVLATAWLDAYSEEAGHEYQLSAFDMHQTQPLIESINTLLERMAQRMDESTLLELKRSRAGMRDLSDESQENAANEDILWDTVDLYPFLAAFAPYEPELTDRIPDLLSNALIGNVPGRDKNVSGIGILFPRVLLNVDFENTFTQYFSGQLPGAEHFIHRYCALIEGRGSDETPSARPEPGQRTSGSGTSSLITSGEQSDQAKNEEGTEGESLFDLKTENKQDEPASNKQPTSKQSTGTSSESSSLITSGKQSDQTKTEEGTDGESLFDLKTENKQNEPASDKQPASEQGPGTSSESSSLITSDTNAAAEPTSKSQVSTDNTGSDELFDLKTDSPKPDAHPSSEEKTYRLQLDKEEMESLVSATGILTVGSVHDGKKIYTDLGTDLDTIIDWESGTVSMDFDGHWMQIGGNIAVINDMRVIEDSLYITVPATVNGESVLLEYLFKGDFSQGQLHRIMDSGNDLGHRALTMLNQSTIENVSLRYWSFTYDNEPDNFEWSGEPIPLDECLTAESGPLQDAYFITFALEDVSGNTTYYDAVPLK